MLYSSHRTWGLDLCVYSDGMQTLSAKCVIWRHMHTAGHAYRSYMQMIQPIHIQTCSYVHTHTHTHKTHTHTFSQTHRLMCNTAPTHQHHPWPCRHANTSPTSRACRAVSASGLQPGSPQSQSVPVWPRGRAALRSGSCTR
jgi:hypothetical protein